jgi:hypothetical protein
VTFARAELDGQPVEKHLGPGQTSFDDYEGFDTPSESETPAGVFIAGVSTLHSSQDDGHPRFPTRRTHISQNAIV